MIRKRNLILVYAVIVFSTSFLLRTIVQAIDNYPFSDAAHPSSEDDGWGFYKRQCTSYVAYRANSAGVAFSNGMIGPNGVAGWFGSALTWETNASTIGYTVNNIPSVGSIAQWNENNGGAGPAGHVAWVKEVNTNGTIFIEEYNWNYGDGSYNERTVAVSNLPDNYIHLNGSTCGSGNVVISNQSLTTGLSCSASNSITISPTTTIQPNSNTVRFYIQ